MDRKLTPQQELAAAKARARAHASRLDLAVHANWRLTTSLLTGRVTPSTVGAALALMAGGARLFRARGRARRRR